MLEIANLPVAVIGGGPIGLAAAAHLAERGLNAVVFEAGETVGANVRDWGHVRIFTTWEQSVDPASRRLLEKNGWKLPAANSLPIGEEIYRDYLAPLGAALGDRIVTNAKVTSITRAGIDKVTTKGRDQKPFELRVLRNGQEEIVLAGGVIDASGTWSNANPLGSSGLPALGEAKHQDRLAYGMPDVLGSRRADYAGKSVAVVGAGYSAINVLLDLVKLASEAPGTKAIWVVRGTNMNKIYGGGDADQLEARGALGMRLEKLVDAGQIQLITGFATHSVAEKNAGVQLIGRTAAGELALAPVDRIIVSTGQRPDLNITRELRLELDPWLESTKALGPMIDPNEHSCGSVPPHGHRELSHPEPGFYTIGVKSYGRAPTFLLLTGYEQARSVAAVIAGDLEAADNVQLVLPETGICSTDFEEGCCGGPPPVKEAGCCVADVIAKEQGKTGCGCAA